MERVIAKRIVEKMNDEEKKSLKNIVKMFIRAMYSNGTLKVAILNNRYVYEEMEKLSEQTKKGFNEKTFFQELYCELLD